MAVKRKLPAAKQLTKFRLFTTFYMAVFTSVCVYKALVIVMGNEEVEIYKEMEWTSDWIAYNNATDNADEERALVFKKDS
jgi:hypothetical protein